MPAPTVSYLPSFISYNFEFNLWMIEFGPISEVKNFLESTELGIITRMKFNENSLLFEIDAIEFDFNDIYLRLEQDFGISALKINKDLLKSVLLLICPKV